MSTLLNIWGTIQRQLFPSLECEIGPLTEKEKDLIQIIAFLDLPRHLSSYQWQGWGRKPKSRLAICKAFIAKAVYRLETTDLLIEYPGMVLSLWMTCFSASRYPCGCRPR